MVDEERGTMPRALETKPTVRPGLQWYLDAFWDLVGDRPFGAMGAIGPISFMAIDCWARRHDVTGEGFYRLKTVIRALDGVYVRHFSKP